MSTLDLFLSVHSGWEQDELDLLSRARRGEADAFGELCRGLEERLLRQAMLICGEAGQAEVLARETLVEAWAGLPKYRARCQFFTWLCAILLKRHHRMHRTSWRRERHLIEAPAPLLESVPDPRPGPAEALERSERLRQVRRCLDRLPRKHRDVVYLRFFVDHSLEHIAEALGCRLGTVKSRLSHALDKMRAMRDLRASEAPAPMDKPIHQLP